MKILFNFIFIFCFSYFSFGKTIVVVASQMTIKESVKQANPYDTLLVKNGYYKENQIVIEIPLFIIGENFPLIDANFENEIFTIKSKNVLVQGFHLINIGKTSIIDWAAIKVLEVSDVSIISNHIERGYFGIYLSACQKCFVQNNLIEGNPSEEQNTGNGIHSWKCDSIEIENNTVFGHRDGIYFEFVTNSLVQNNFCSKNIRYGLHFMFSHKNAYENNIFRNNGAGVAVMYTKGMTMRNNHFDENLGSSSYGLLLKDISDSQIENNTFSKNTTGIFMEGTNRCHISNNAFFENGWAIRMQANCDANVLIDNSFNNNSFDIATNGSVV